MARKKSKARIMKRRKVEPAPQTLNFVYTVPAGSVTENYIDLSQVTSLVNRRFYRQGLNWAVNGFKFLTYGSTSSAQVTVTKLPTTWTMSNAWHKGFVAWQRMNNEALEEAESVRPRFLDFKIYADASHHTAGFAGNLLPTSDLAQALPGEWEPSKYVIPRGPASPGNTLEREVIAVGASYPGAGASALDAVSLIEGYASSRGLPEIQDPNTPDDALDATGTVPENWMSALFNEGTSQTAGVLDEMITENNIAPYPFENDGVNPDTMYPGGANQLTGLQIHDNSFISSTTVGGVTRLKGGQFPCGLVKITSNNFDESDDLNVILLLDLVPGPHRGYLALPMQEM